MHLGFLGGRRRALSLPRRTALSVPAACRSRRRLRCLASRRTFGRTVQQPQHPPDPGLTCSGRPALPIQEPDERVEPWRRSVDVSNHPQPEPCTIQATDDEPNNSLHHDEATRCASQPGAETGLDIARLSHPGPWATTRILASWMTGSIPTPRSGPISVRRPALLRTPPDRRTPASLKRTTKHTISADQLPCYGL